MHEFAVNTPAQVVAGSGEVGLAMLALVLFKLAVIGAGITFVVLGYRLFCLGVRGTSDVKGEGHGFQLTFKRAAPGSIFALFGCLLIAITGFKGLTLTFPTTGGQFGGQAFASTALEYKIETGEKGVSPGEALNKAVARNAPAGWQLEAVTEQEGDGPLAYVFRRVRQGALPINYDVVIVTDNGDRKAVNEAIEKRRDEGWDLVSVSEQGAAGTRRVVCLFRKRPSAAATAS